MGNLIRLETLNIESSGLRGSIPLPIFKISSLKIMDFTNNSLSGALPKNMCSHLSFLEELHLSYNQLTGSIPSDLWGCRELMILSLFNNKLTGSIPREIGSLTAIKELHLRFNNLKDTISSFSFFFLYKHNFYSIT